MATKIFCDGCGKDITDNTTDARKGLRVKATTNGGDVVLGQFEVGPFDLCGGCIGQFKRDCDPRTWPRAATDDRRPVYER